MPEHRIQADGFDVAAFLLRGYFIPVATDQIAEFCAFGFGAGYKNAVIHFGFDFARIKFSNQEMKA